MGERLKSLMLLGAVAAGAFVCSPQQAQAYMTSATITVDASQVIGDLPRYEKLNNIGITKLKGDKEIALLNEIDTSLVRTFLFTIDSYGFGVENSYDYSKYYPVLDQIVATGAAPLVSISHVPEWLADLTYSSNGDNLMGLPPSDLAKYEAMVTSMLTHYKAKYPSIVYVEAWNEPDFKRPGMSKAIEFSTYLQIYEAHANAVAAVNASLPAGVAPLKLGGPTIAHELDWIYDLIDYCKANGVQLDFVSWHNYSSANGVVKLKNEVTLVKNYLAQNNMSEVETMVNEYGVVGGGTNANPTAAELAKTAAFMAAADVQFMDAAADKPMHWGARHGSNKTKSQFGDADGIVFPFYNVLKMQSMQRTSRISLTSDSKTSVGLGVNGVASSDSNGLAVMLWNYQNNGTTGFDVTANVYNLPAQFTGKQVRMETYLIDESHSNWAYNASQATLQKIDDQVLPPSSTLSQTIGLSPNSVALIMLTPFDAVLAAEEFDGMTTGSAPPGWTVSTPAQTSAEVTESPSASDKSIRFEDNSSTGYASVEKTFSAQSGLFTAEWKFMVPAPLQYGRMFVSSGATNYAIMIYTKDDGTLVYRDNSGTDRPVQKILPGIWYSVKVVGDAAANTFDLYINGTLKQANAEFRNVVTSVDRVQYGSGLGSTGALHIDSVRVTN